MLVNAQEPFRLTRYARKPKSFEYPICHFDNGLRLRWMQSILALKHCAGVCQQCDACLRCQMNGMKDKAFRVPRQQIHAPLHFAWHLVS
ncbi:hypothetical protein Y043_2856 [Burkholderia pseudomallei MSHR2138]|nr:hypothetical protein Y043_2856 [Burkholderia pseudomallei MSHR2138]KGX47848.1 hypothetical protein Y600_6017 [Burkholderia pseudomallei MSHR3709]